MTRSDPYILMSKDATAKIAESDLYGGALALRYSPGNDLYVVAVVEYATNFRLPVDVPREYTALRSGDIMKTAQWVRVRSDEPHIYHLLLSRRPNAMMEFDEFTKLVRGVVDPGNNLGIVITHAPAISREIVDAGGCEFAGWAVLRNGVRPLRIETEPGTTGIQQLADQWPVDRLAGNSIMVVGCGSIGSASAEALAGYGVGRVELVDPDRFVWHNMIRHLLGPESVGQFKVTAIKDRLARESPEQVVVAHQLDVAADAHLVRPIVDRVDLVLCAADGVAPRRVVSHLSRRAGRPAILACVLDSGSVGEIIRLRPTPNFGCLLCLRRHLAEEGAMDAEADQELDYGTGSSHRPMSAIPTDLRYVGILAAKVAVATLLESLHGDHDQRLPGEHAIIGLRPSGDLAEPFNLGRVGEVRWSGIPRPRSSCATCSAQ